MKAGSCQDTVAEFTRLLERSRAGVGDFRGCGSGPGVRTIVVAANVWFLPDIAKLDELPRTITEQPEAGCVEKSRALLFHPD